MPGNVAVMFVVVNAAVTQYTPGTPAKVVVVVYTVDNAPPCAVVAKLIGAHLVTVEVPESVVYEVYTLLTAIYLFALKANAPPTTANRATPDKTILALFIDYVPFNSKDKTFVLKYVPTLFTGFRLPHFNTSRREHRNLSA